MFQMRGYCWGPTPLPEFLVSQLASHGFSPNDAGRCARRIGDLPPGSEAVAPLFVSLGSCKFLDADIDGAIAAWRHAISSGHDAAGAEALLNMGLLYEHLQQPAQALGLFARVTERDVAPYVVPAAMASARCQVALGDDARAMETMARLAQRVMAIMPAGPDLGRALFGLGDIAEHAGRLDRAERSWRAVLTNGDADIRPAASDRLGQLLVARGQHGAVLDLIAAGTLAVEHSGPVLLDTAEHYLQQDEPELAAEAVAWVDGAQSVAHDRFRLADVKLACGHVNEAIDELEALVNHTDESVHLRALFRLGQVYKAHDMVDPAASMYERVVQANNVYWSPLGALALGDHEASRGDTAAATAHWNSVIDGGSDRVAAQAQLRLADLTASATDAERDDQGSAPEPSDQNVSDTTADAAVPVPAPAAGVDGEPSTEVGDPIAVPVAPTANTPLIAPSPQPDLTQPEEAEQVSAQVISLDDIDDNEPGILHDPADSSVAPAPPHNSGNQNVESEEDASADEPVALVLNDVVSTTAALPDPVVDLASGSSNPGDASDSVVGLASGSSNPGDASDSVVGLASGSSNPGDASDPVVGLASGSSNPGDASDSVVDRTLARPSLPAARTSAFARHLEEVNPYAALAPDHEQSDVAPTTRNPYAELAPNFDDIEFDPPPDVEPGDWESMLEDWPRTDPKQKPKKRPSAFSRYT